MNYRKNLANDSIFQNLPNDIQSFLLKIQSIAHKILDEKKIETSQQAEIIELIHHENEQWCSYVIHINLEPKKTSEINWLLAEHFESENLSADTGSQNVIFRFESIQGDHNVHPSS